jgi:exodeoxyribonuclease VII small subunit
MKEKLTYQKAYDELAKIVEEIEEGKVKLDTLSDKITRATELIGFCQSGLRSAEEEFKKALGKLAK